MISAKKLLKLARKWQKLTAIKRKRITMPLTNEAAQTSSCSTSAKAEKGHFVVYSADQKRFLLPLEYLDNEMMRELFNMAEQEFGLCRNEPLTSIASSCSSFHLQHQQAFCQLQICRF